MEKEILENYPGSIAKQKTRRLLKNGRNSKYDDPVFSVNGTDIKVPCSIMFTGSAAIWCMCEINQPDEVFLIGFDGLDNIYSNTKNYEIPGNMLKSREDLKTIVDSFPRTNFYFVTADGKTNEAGFRCSFISWGSMLEKLLTAPSVVP
jgi:hypothetical protein